LAAHWQLSPNLRKTEETRSTERAAAAAAAGGDQPKKPPPKKRGGAEGGGDGGAGEQARSITPRDLEIQKLDRLLGLGEKAGAAL
jgi:hypothetical protein